MCKLSFLFPGPVHKSTLVALLNASPTEALSKDRLRRVRNQQNLSTETTTDGAIAQHDTINYRTEFGLYSDVAIFIKDRGSPPTFKLGRIHRMLKPGNVRGKLEFKRPISLNDEQHQNVELTLTMYAKQCDQRGVFKYLPGNTRDFTVYSVIMGVKLSIQDNECYTLDEQDCQELEAFLQSQAAPTRINRNTETHNRREQDIADDGRRVTIVEPTDLLSDNRRSRRRRRHIDFEN